MLNSFLRILSDCFYVALYAIRYDKGLWAPNVLALVISVALNIVLIPIAGFLAVVLVSNLVTLATVMLRAFLLVLRLKETW
jgi:O-antigen/teichoic acid export membrane protein